MRAVNLLPQDAQRKGLNEGARTPLLLAAGGIALVTIVAAFLASVASMNASASRSDVDSVDAAITALPKPPEQAVSQNMLIQERSERVSALAQALNGRVSFDRLLRQISYVLPEDAWLTQLDAKAPVAADPAAAATPPGTAAASTDLTIQGETWTHENVAVLLARLAAVPSLSNVHLTGSNRVEPGSEEGVDESSDSPDRPYVTFVVAASIRTEAKP
jgi:Tfp pilus assembly protein PilN